jgi:hypothetical protein
MGALAYAQKDELANLVYNQVCPAVEMPLETGTGRELNERAYFLELNVAKSKNDVADTFTISDSTYTYNITPISKAFEFSNIDLAQASAYGKASEAEMIREMQDITAMILKKSKEKAFYTAVSDNNNFEGATYYANAATAWSSTGLADMKDDITAARLVVKGLTDMVMSDTAYLYAADNSNLLASTTVSGPRKDGSVDPYPEVAFLQNYFNVPRIYVAAGDLITDTSDPTDTTRTEIWGDKILLLRNTMAARKSPRLGQWIKHLMFRPNGRGEPNEGWWTIETRTEEEGGVGMRKFATWNYYQFMVQEESYAYRIDSVY